GRGLELERRGGLPRLRRDRRGRGGLGEDGQRIADVVGPDRRSGQGGEHAGGLGEPDVLPLEGNADAVVDRRQDVDRVVSGLFCAGQQDLRRGGRQADG